MKNVFCKGGDEREVLAISLCLASATIMSLEALHTPACLWMGLDAEQSYALSALIATLSMFLGVFILARRIGKT